MVTIEFYLFENDFYSIFIALITDKVIFQVMMQILVWWHKILSRLERHGINQMLVLFIKAAVTFWSIFTLQFSLIQIRHAILSLNRLVKHHIIIAKSKPQATLTLGKQKSAIYQIASETNHLKSNTVYLPTHKVKWSSIIL